MQPLHAKQIITAIRRRAEHDIKISKCFKCFFNISRLQMGTVASDNYNTLVAFFKKPGKSLEHPLTQIAVCLQACRETIPKSPSRQLCQKYKCIAARLQGYFARMLQQPDIDAQGCRIAYISGKPRFDFA